MVKQAVTESIKNGIVHPVWLILRMGKQSGLLVNTYLVVQFEKFLPNNLLPRQKVNSAKNTT